MADEISKTENTEASLQADAVQASVPSTETAPDTPAPFPQQSQGQETPQKDVVMADISLEQAAVCTISRLRISTSSSSLTFAFSPQLQALRLPGQVHQHKRRGQRLRIQTPGSACHQKRLHTAIRPGDI